MMYRYMEPALGFIARQSIRKELSLGSAMTLSPKPSALNPNPT